MNYDNHISTWLPNVCLAEKWFEQKDKFFDKVTDRLGLKNVSKTHVFSN